jgi:hypothetical protein
LKPRLEYATPNILRTGILKSGYSIVAPAAREALPHLPAWNLQGNGQANQNGQAASNAARNLIAGC